MSLNLDLDALYKISGQAGAVGVYGFKSTGYIDMTYVLFEHTAKSSTLKHVLNYESINQNTIFESTALGLSDNDIKIKGMGKWKKFKLALGMETHKAELIRTKRECKSALDKLVLENYVRKKMGLPIIPLLFFVEKDDGKYGRLDAKAIAKGHSSDGQMITYAELRRCYKLCCEMGQDPKAREIAKVALETFKFIRIREGKSTVHFTELRPIWQDREWSQAWSERGTKAKTSKWKTSLLAAVEKSDKLMYKKALEIEAELNQLTEPKKK